jgi:hypothetical protein
MPARLGTITRTHSAALARCTIIIIIIQPAHQAHSCNIHHAEAKIVRRRMTHLQRLDATARNAPARITHPGIRAPLSATCLSATSTVTTCLKNLNALISANVKEPTVGQEQQQVPARLARCKSQLQQEQQPSALLVAVVHLQHTHASKIVQR